MSDDADDFLDESLIRRDLSIPVIYQLFHQDGNDGIELQVDLVATAQRGEQLIDWPSVIGYTCLLRAKNSSYQGHIDLVGCD